MTLGSNVREIKEFKPNIDYGVHITPQTSKVLSILKRGQKFIINDFVNDHLKEFTEKETSKQTNKCLVYNAFRIGRKSGIQLILKLII